MHSKTCTCHGPSRPPSSPCPTPGISDPGPNHKLSTRAPSSLISVPTLPIAFDCHCAQLTAILRRRAKNPINFGQTSSSKARSARLNPNSSSDLRTASAMRKGSIRGTMEHFCVRRILRPSQCPLRLLSPGSSCIGLGSDPILLRSYFVLRMLLPQCVRMYIAISLKCTSRDYEALATKPDLPITLIYAVGSFGESHQHLHSQSPS